ncbi:MAG TPA: hypothetical protein VN031_03765 [Candidatus Microsaccharimonas sp.]|nr:hypothetical protein [Candidatus Microsaccharimonas sp.]
MNLLPSMKAQKQAQRQADFDKALIHHEAKIGGQLFGSVPAGTRREFFCLDEHTWVWHEEWTDRAGKRQMMTTRYDVRPDGVLKSQGGNSYRKLQGEEARNFRMAVQNYCRQVLGDYDRMLAA